MLLLGLFSSGYAQAEEETRGVAKETASKHDLTYHEVDLDED